MSEIKVRGGEYWHGNHKGVYFKVQKWESNGDIIWNYYVHLVLPKINDVDARKLWLTARASKHSRGRKLYKYYGCEPLNDIEMQGGITWYRKYFGLQDEKIIEIGCDYNHIWNDRDYDLNDILGDVELTIDSVIKRFPEIALQPLAKGAN